MSAVTTPPRRRPRRETKHPTTAERIALGRAARKEVPRLLLHRRVSRRDLLPGAVITVAGLAMLHVAASFILRRWLVSYSSTYGGLGIVMAILFWLIAAATVMMFAAALSPAVAAHRAAVRAGAAGSANGLPGGAG